MWWRMAFRCSDSNKFPFWNDLRSLRQCLLGLSDLLKNAIHTSYSPKPLRQNLIKNFTRKFRSRKNSRQSGKVLWKLIKSSKLVTPVYYFRRFCGIYQDLSPSGRFFFVVKWKRCKNENVMFRRSFYLGIICQGVVAVSI